MVQKAYEYWVPGQPDSRPRADAQEAIDRAVVICRQFAADGYDLTLRQLYYQFVSKGWLPNTERDYKRLGDIVSRARMSGMLDWDWIVDRGRSLYGTPHKDSPGDAITMASYTYHRDHWQEQDRVVEVWVEKDALSGVVGRACGRWDVNYFPCKGYTSVSAAHEAGMRIRRYARAGKDVTVLYLGDHDPSGLDMTRDVRDRLETFMGSFADRLDVKRIALNRDQVDQYQPPPNPAKLTDSRAADYVAEHGYESWELDALPPDVLDTLISGEIAQLVDQAAYDDAENQQRRDIRLLRRAAERWDAVVAMLEEDGDLDLDE